MTNPGISSDGSGIHVSPYNCSNFIKDAHDSKLKLVLTRCAV